MTVTAEQTDQQLADAEYEAILDRLRSYVESLEEAKEHRAEGNAKADHRIDLGSLDRAADLERLYQDKRWVDRVPAPARKKRGRRVQRDSREQFIKFANDEIKSRKTGKPMGKPWVFKLFAAQKLVGILSPVPGVGDKIQGSAERALRPLSKMLDDRIDEIPEVWRRAVQLADGKTPTNKQVQQARDDYDKELSPPSPSLSLPETEKVKKARTIRERMERDLQELAYLPGGPAEFEVFKRTMKKILTERAA